MSLPTFFFDYCDAIFEQWQSHRFVKLCICIKSQNELLNIS